MAKFHKNVSSSYSSPPSPSENTHYFFKVYVPSLSLHDLKLSTNFIKKLNGGAVPRKAILKDPLKRLWTVEVKNINGDFYFQKGWKEFVKYNCLKLGEFLVFMSMGNYVFDVIIFDSSACQKEDFMSYSNAKKTTTSPFMKMKTDHEPEESLDLMGNMNKMTLSEEDDESEDTDETLSESDSVFKEEESQEEEEEEEDEICKTKRSAATNGVSKLPYFIASVRPRCHYNLNIPSRLLTVHNLKLKKEMILRDPSGMPWPVRICFTSDGRKIITKGWCNFWKGNNLTPDDKCIFEFKKDEESGKTSNVINVKIFRAMGGRSLTPHNTSTGIREAEA